VGRAAVAGGVVFRRGRGDALVWRRGSGVWRLGFGVTGWLGSDFCRLVVPAGAVDVGFVHYGFVRAALVAGECSVKIRSSGLSRIGFLRIIIRGRGFCCRRVSTEAVSIEDVT